MKKLLLKTMLLLCALIVGGASSVWADDPITIASFSNSSTTGWTITGSPSYSGTGGYQLIANTMSIASPSITWSDYTNVTITLKARKYGGPDATQGRISISLGGSELASCSPSSTTLSYYENIEIAPSSTGKITISCPGASSSKGCGVSEIIIKGKLATTAEATTTVIDASEVKNNIFGDNTDGGTLTATVYDSSDDAIAADAVTWSSSDETVATINSTTGVVTLKKVGSTTITASYAGVTDEYQSSSTTYTLTVINEDPDIEEIWSENFSTYKADDVPNGGSYSYACTDGSGTTKVYTQNNAGGTSPELLVGNTNGTFSATVTLLHSTYGYSGDLSLKFKSNANSLNVKSGTDGITVDGEATEGAGLTFTTKDIHTVTFKGVTTATENITIVFKATTGSNVRLDDIVLKGKRAALTFVATPSISPASGAVASGSEVTMTCATEDATIYYTTDGTTPTSSSTAYNPSCKPTITSACTIKAIGIKEGLTDSDVATATYTIAVPCATPTFSVAAGEVSKGTTVSLSCATDGATIYYTTNGTTPNTSSSSFSSAITINTAQTIKAIAVKDGYANSEVASATYTVIDYASLTFSFDNGSSTIESTTGLTQSGLGSDYASSPKLKFDNTGDYVLLKIGQAPGVLSFDIKGNPGSGSWTGTFKVQTSVDGSSYSDLAVYTDNLSTSKETKTLTMSSDVRYIKWILTDKKANVALGNIQLTGCETATVSAAGYATYKTTGKVCFPTGVKGYIATATNASTVTLTSKESVPAGTPIVLKAAEGTYYLPIITSSPETVTDNLLQVSDGSVTGGDNIYALSNVGGTVGFYQVSSDLTIATGKVYLDTSASGAKAFLTFDFDEADGIGSIDNGQLTMDNERIFRLDGTRVNGKITKKGLYIRGGRKVVVR